MLIDKDISIHLSCQQFECKSFEITDEKTVLMFTSNRSTGDVVCPYRGGRVHVYDSSRMVLRDMPLWHGVPLCLDVNHHGYRCTVCGRSFSEDICMRYPGTRITYRTAKWVQELLRWHLPVSSVHEITGFHWDTIRRIHESVMREALDFRRKELQDKGHRPRHLAIDEFAIHKGHRYATCVMDLDEGDILWVGRGRSKADFARFFDEVDPDCLSDVEAVAMDMNASYNILVEQHLPHAEIVYDRYHMQAQYGKDVLGVVRLQEAREHRQRSRELVLESGQQEDPAERRILRDEARRQSRLYSTLKSSRWTLLANAENLSPEKAENLNSILDSHSDLALCYAMKEEMCSLFELRDPDEARRGWTGWFEGATLSLVYGDNAQPFKAAPTKSWVDFLDLENHKGAVTASCKISF